MKLLLCILFASVLAAYGQPIFHAPALVGAINKPTGASLPTYLINEGFDGVGAPAGWSRSSANVDWDSTATVLSGTQSLRLDATSSTEYAFVSIGTPKTNLWAHFIIQCTVPVLSKYLFVWADSSFNERGYLKVGGSGQLIIANGSVTASTANGELTSANPLHVWLHHQSGSGTDGVSDVYTSATATKPGSPAATITLGTATAAIQYPYFAPEASEGVVIVDEYRVAESVIPSNP